jgi:hypothetical protein
MGPEPNPEGRHQLLLLLIFVFSVFFFIAKVMFTSLLWALPFL